MLYIFIIFLIIYLGWIYYVIMIKKFLIKHDNRYIQKFLDNVIEKLLVN